VQPQSRDRRRRDPPAPPYNPKIEIVVVERFAVHLESKINSVVVCFVLKEKGGMTRLTQNKRLVRTYVDGKLIEQ